MHLYLKSSLSWYQPLLHVVHVIVFITYSFTFTATPSSIPLNRQCMPPYHLSTTSASTAFQSPYHRRFHPPTYDGILDNFSITLPIATPPLFVENLLGRHVTGVLLLSSLVQLTMFTIYFPWPIWLVSQEVCSPHFIFDYTYDIQNDSTRFQVPSYIIQFEGILQLLPSWIITSTLRYVLVFCIRLTS